MWNILLHYLRNSQYYVAVSQHGGAGCLRVERRAVLFLRNKYDRVALKQLKSAIIDFYTKLRLLSDIRTLEKTVKFPHVPQRRDGENRAAREVEDIVNLFNCLDERFGTDTNS